MKGKNDEGSSSNGSGRDGNPSLSQIFMVLFLVLMAANVAFFPERPLMTTSDVMAYPGVISWFYPPIAYFGAYYWWLCERAFAEYQWLNGNIISSNIWQAEEEMMVLMPPDEGCSSQPPLKRQRVERLHQCTTCGRVFPTGQALGGHMRAHYRGDLSRPRRANAPDNNIPGGADGHSTAVHLNNVVSDENVVPEVVDDRFIIFGQILSNSNLPSTSHLLDLDLNVALVEESEQEDHDEEVDQDSGD